jgi:hypothetical protein
MTHATAFGDPVVARHGADDPSAPSSYDGSRHLALPPAQAADLVAHGWGVFHPWAGTRLAAGFVMLFGPRTAEELETVAGVVAASRAYADSPTGGVADQT